MRIGTNKLYFLIIFFFAFANYAIAQRVPPPPPGEPTPILPIDEYMIFVVMLSLIFGAALIYNGIKKQTP